MRAAEFGEGGGGNTSEGEISLFLYPSSEEENGDDGQARGLQERGREKDWRRHGYEGATAAAAVKGEEWERESGYSENDDGSVSSSAVSIQTTFLHSILPDLSPTWRTGTSTRPPLLLGDRKPMSLSELFALEDRPENLLLDGEGKIVAATRWKLVERLTTDPDVSFADDFLMVYRQFMDAAELAQLLAYRLEQSFCSNEMDLAARQNLKLRTFVVLRSWLRDYYEVDFDNNREETKRAILDVIQRIRGRALTLTLPDQQILIKLRKMVLAEDQLVYDSGGTSVASESLPAGTSGGEGSDSLSIRSSRSSLMGRLSGRLKRILRLRGEPGAAPTDPDALSISSLATDDTTTTIGTRQSTDTPHPPTLAGRMPRQLAAAEQYLQRFQRHSCLAIESSGALCSALTVIESQTFAWVDWRDLLNYPQSWEEGGADRLRQTIAHFNEVCEWVQQEILRSSSHREQAVIIKKLIRVTLKCLGCCNFNTVMEIMLALQHPTIQDIGPAWERVTGQERELFGDLVDFVSPLKNFGNIRRATELQEIALTPCVPFVGLTLSDLASNHERPSGHAALIPWYKHQAAARIIRQFRSFQSPERKYDLAVDPRLLHYLRESLAQMADML